jgi:hypothetical protein
MRINEFAALPGEIVSEEDLDRLVGGKDKSSGGGAMRRERLNRDKKYAKKKRKGRMSN